MDDLRYTTTEEDAGLYVKEVLQRRLRISSRLMRKLKFSGGVALNGEPTPIKVRVKAGDLITVSYPEEQSYFEPYEYELDVPFEDPDLLVVNKPAGMVVHPTKGCLDRTLANALVYRMEQSGEVYKPRFVNRLDRDTSGLVIVGKNSHCQDFLMHEMDAGRVEKLYLAIASGSFGGVTAGTIDLPIAKDPDHTARRAVLADGFPSVTHFEVLGEANGYSLLRLRLETGRTHQIRVHMSYTGHTLLGDDLYGGKSPLMGRQALHAYSLSFTHPVSGEKIYVRATLPEDMLSAARALDLEDFYEDQILRSRDRSDRLVPSYNDGEA
jgi:23S rRNA pseudouridine1911/1915/1917 synthase